MHDIFNIQLSDVPAGFDESRYVADRKDVQAFMLTFCRENGIPDRVRYYYHFKKFGGNQINFLACKTNFIAKNYEACYTQIIQNLSVAVLRPAYYPLCHWLVESGLKLNKLEEIKEAVKKLQPTVLTKKVLSVIAEHQNEKKEIPKSIIVYSFNQGYKKAFFASIVSFKLANRHLLPNLYFVIGYDKTIDSQEIKLFLDRLNVNYSLVDMESICNFSLRESYDNTTEFVLDRSCYYRIFLLRKLFKEQQEEYSRALYIDADTLILGDLSSLLSAPMNLPLKAKNEKVTEEAVKKAKRINSIDYYFNSGILVLDLKNQEVGNCLDVAIDASRHKQDKLMLQDQCALNIGFNHKVQPLHEQYNFMLHMHETINTEKEMKILHFTGRIKPWDPAYVDNPFFRGLWLSIYSTANHVLTFDK